MYRWSSSREAYWALALLTITVAEDGEESGNVSAGRRKFSPNSTTVSPLIGTVGCLQQRSGRAVPPHVVISIQTFFLSLRYSKYIQRLRSCTSRGTVGGQRKYAESTQSNHRGTAQTMPSYSNHSNTSHSIDKRLTEDQKTWEGERPRLFRLPSPRPFPLPAPFPASLPRRVICELAVTECN